MLHRFMVLLVCCSLCFTASAGAQQRFGIVDRADEDPARCTPVCAIRHKVSDEDHEHDECGSAAQVFAQTIDYTGVAR